MFYFVGAGASAGASSLYSLKSKSEAHKLKIGIFFTSFVRSHVNALLLRHQLILWPKILEQSECVYEWVYSMNGQRSEYKAPKMERQGNEWYTLLFMWHHRHRHTHSLTQDEFYNKIYDVFSYMVLARSLARTNMLGMPYACVRVIEPNVNRMWRFSQNNVKSCWFIVKIK